MAISNFGGNKEVTLTKDLLSPDGDPLGIKFDVRSDKCKAASSVSKKIAASAITLDLNTRKGAEDDAVVKWLRSQTDLQTERMVACIASIDWGDEEWNEGEGPLEFTPENVAMMVSEEWIAVQVAQWIQEVGDFIKA